MSGSFETDDAHADFHLKPLRVPVRVEGIFEEAVDMVGALRGWTLVSSDAASHTVVARRAAGFLSGSATVTIRCEAPEDLPSTTVRVRSESTGGVLSRDRANVLEFMRPFHRRVC